METGALHSCKLKHLNYRYALQDASKSLEIIKVGMCSLKLFTVYIAYVTESAKTGLICTKYTCLFYLNYLFSVWVIQ